MNCRSVRYSANRTIQSFEVPATGHYWIEAASALTLGRRIHSKGRFYLQQGDLLRIVVGRADGTTPSADLGRQGNSFVWQRAINLGGSQYVMLVTTGVAITFEEALEHASFQPAVDWSHPDDGYILIAAAQATQASISGLAYVPPPSGSSTNWEGANVRWPERPCSGPGL